MLNNNLFNSIFFNSTAKWNRMAHVFISDIANIGLKSVQIENPDQQPAQFYTDLISVTPFQEYTLSNYTQGNGNSSIQYRGYSLAASGVDDITSFYRAGQSYDFSLVSGSWNRNSFKFTVPSGVAYIRAFTTLSGQWIRADDFQFEIGEISPIEQDFIADLILPKRLVKAEIGFSEDNVPKFTGLIDSFTPDIKEDTVSVHAYDLADKVKDFMVTSELLADARSDELIAFLADACGIPESERILEVGEHISKYAWFPEASAWTYMNQIAEAEGGRVFFDESGKLNFWNRTTSSYQNRLPVYTFTLKDHIINSSYQVAKGKIKNRIVVKAKPKTLLDTTTIFYDTTAPVIEVGETKEFWCQFSHDQETTVPAINVEYPVIGVDIKGNTAQDGSGYEVISQLSITSSSLFAESFKLNIKNSYTEPVYLYHFELFGQPIVIEKEIDIIREDSVSQGLYDVQELQIENNFIDDEFYAASLAETKLATMKEPRNFLEIEVVGVPYLQVGDVVSVEESFDGIFGNYTIVKNSWQLDGDFVQKLTLEKKITL